MDSYANRAAAGQQLAVHLLPTVYLLCGLNGAGKTTLAKELQTALPAVRFSLDEAGVRHLAGIFEPPGPDEGLEIRPVSGR